MAAAGEVATSAEAASEVAAGEEALRVEGASAAVRVAVALVEAVMEVEEVPQAEVATARVEMVGPKEEAAAQAAHLLARAEAPQAAGMQAEVGIAVASRVAAARAEAMWVVEVVRVVEVAMWAV